MNYQKCYDSIIARAKGRMLSGYVERHHILPRSLGGSNDQSNIAILTFREHFICHLLLTKMHSGQARQKMIHALWQMSNDSRSGRALTSRSFESARKLFKDMMHEKRAGKPVVEKGYKFSEERNAKVSKALTGKKRAPFTAEHRENMSKAFTGRKQKPKTEEQKRKYSEAAKLRWQRARDLKSSTP